MATKPVNLRDKLKEATAEEILAAAETELAERGPAATAMSSIARRAGVSVGTLYNYFEDKDMLLATLIADRRKRFSALLDEAFAAHAARPFEAQLAGIVEGVLKIFDAQRNYLRIVWESDRPKAQQKSGERQFADRLRPIVEAGVASGALAPQDADLYAAALAALIRGVVVERLSDTRRSLSDASAFVLRLFLQGARR